MKKFIAATVVAAAAVTGSVAVATPASASSWWNGKFISSGSYCNVGATGCRLKIHVGELDCRPFVGADLNRCINESTTHDYRYPGVWRESPVYGCNSLYGHPYGVANGARIDSSGVISKLNGAKVTVQYGSLSGNKTDYIRCM